MQILIHCYGNLVAGKGGAAPGLIGGDAYRAVRLEDYRAAVAPRLVRSFVKAKELLGGMLRDLAGRKEFRAVSVSCNADPQ